MSSADTICDRSDDSGRSHIRGDLMRYVSLNGFQVGFGSFMNLWLRIESLLRRQRRRFVPTSALSMPRNPPRPLPPLDALWDLANFHVHEVCELILREQI